MICNFCKKVTAVVSIEHAFDGVSKHIYLCKECAAKVGLDSFSNNIDISITNILKKEEILKQNELKKNLTCPTCSRKLSDIILEQKIACVDCFSTFNKEIVDVLKNKKSDLKYTGKIPISATEEFDKAVSVIKLKQKLKVAVDNEEYEQAAIFRDELKILEGENV